jgi:hypothetical protein
MLLSDLVAEILIKMIQRVPKLLWYRCKSWQFECFEFWRILGKWYELSRTVKTTGMIREVRFINQTKLTKSVYIYNSFKPITTPYNNDFISFRWMTAIIFHTYHYQRLKGYVSYSVVRDLIVERWQNIFSIQAPYVYLCIISVIHRHFCC